jgi:ribosome-binding factor A
MNLKFTPAISFYLDASLDYAMKIEDLLNKIHKDPPESKE